MIDDRQFHHPQASEYRAEIGKSPGSNSRMHALHMQKVFMINFGRSRNRRVASSSVSPPKFLHAHCASRSPPYGSKSRSEGRFEFISRANELR